MTEEMTGINRETVCKTLVKDSKKKKKVCGHFIPHFLTLDQKHTCPVSSVEMTDNDRNVLKRIVTDNMIWPCLKQTPRS
jgi:hypothetical protein